MAGGGRVYVGTSGWVYRHWRGPFYPAELPTAAWFGHYTRTFNAVEVNNSFYRLPSPEVFAAWARQAPPGFVYAVKASRFLTHRKKLKAPEDSLEMFLGRARRLGPHLGPVLYQLPPRWHCNADRLRHFLDLLPPDLSHVFEFRDPSWYNDEVRTILTEKGAGFCIHDLRGAGCPDWVTGPLVYLRFHGPTRQAYAGSYPHAHLEHWAGRIDGYRRAGLDVYAYFNNDDRGHAAANARTLQELLTVAPAPDAPQRSGSKSVGAAWS